MIRKLLLVIAVSMLAVAIGSPAASASTSFLSFGDDGSLSDVTHFTALSPGVLEMSVGDGNGIWEGMGFVNGLGDFTGKFDFASSGPLMLDFNPAFQRYDVSGLDVDFSITSGFGTLMGVVALNTFHQDNSRGLFNSEGAANLTIVTSSGFFASLMGGAASKAIVSVVLDLPDVDLSSLNPGDSVDANFSTAEVIPPAVPEPGTMLLLGTGLLVVAGLLRRRVVVTA